MSEWIEASTQLPEAGTTVLTFTSSNRIVIRKFCKCKFSEMTDKVTHWMPLPKIPNMVE